MKPAILPIPSLPSHMANRNIPSVCPIEFTGNPVYSKTFWNIHCFLDKPFSLGTIHIGSLYPLQGRMGKVYLQKRTQAFLKDLFLKMNMWYVQMGWVSYSGIVESLASDIDTHAIELQLCCFPDTCKLSELVNVSECQSPHWQNGDNNTKYISFTHKTP